MINVKDTIYSTIKDRVDKLRFLAVNDAKAFKKILYLIIMDDVYDWSSYIGGSQKVQDIIQHLRYDFIRHNEEFLIERDIDASMYVNVNTPQTNNTWKRVWDDPNVVLVKGAFTPSTTPQKFVPDPSCEVGIIFFPDKDLFGGIHVGANGQPDVNLNKLTTCEKMNIFINRNTGKMYYLDESCNWKPVTQQLMSKITLDDLAFQVPQGITHSYAPVGDNSDILNINLSDNPGGVTINIADADKLEDIL